MAFTGIETLNAAAPRGLWSRVRQRVEALLAGEHFHTQKVAGTAFAIRIASAGIVFVSQILLARWMGSYQFGSYVYVWTWLLMAGDIVHLGMPLTAQRFIPEYTETKSFDLLRGYLSGSRWLSLAAGAAFAVLGGLVVYALDDRFDNELFLPFYFACLALPAYILTFMADGTARSYNWINLALMPAYIVRPVLLVAGVAALHFSGAPMNATTVLGVLAAAAWLSVALQMLQLDRRLRKIVPRGPKRYEVRRWLTTALPMILVWGLYTLLTSTDILVLKHYRPAYEVAHYFAAAKLLALISMIYFAVAASAAHRFTTYHVAGDRDGLAAFAASTVRWIFWLSLGLNLVILAGGAPLLMLFGPDYVAAQPVMAILSVGLLARASVGPAERLLTMLGHQRVCAVAYVAAFAFNFGVCILLVPHYGLIGAAVATAGGFVVESIALFIIARRSLGLHMFIWRPRGVQ
jgi:O-antigen/teichoic acid export membrane protein